MNDEWVDVTFVSGLQRARATLGLVQQHLPGDSLPVTVARELNEVIVYRVDAEFGITGKVVQAIRADAGAATRAA